jgi:uncharacterized protein (TIGR02453 family)
MGATARARVTAGPASFFTPRTLSFLRALKRNNDGAWFRAHKADYVAHVQAPLHRLLETLADEQYRDTRFSEDKSPLKTYVAFVLRPRGFPKGSAAGLYAQFDWSETWIGGGLYHPEPAIRTAVREHIAAHHRRLAAIVGAPAFRKQYGALEGDLLTRVPRGFDPDHPAAAFLKHKDWLASRTYPGALATSADFYPTLLELFRAAAPLIRFLNEPIAAQAARTLRDA